MKKTLFVFFAFFALNFITGCKALQNLNGVVSKVQEKCGGSEATYNQITQAYDVHISCNQLLTDTQVAKIKSKCPNAKVTLDIANGSATVDVSCTSPDVLAELKKILFSKL